MIRLRSNAGLRAETRRRDTAQTAAAAVASVRDGAALAVRSLGNHAPRDTNRYANGWQSAGLSLGLAGRVEPLHESKYWAWRKGKVASALKAERANVKALRERREVLYPHGPPKKPRTGRYGWLTRKMWKAQARADRLSVMADELGEDPTALLMTGGGRLRAIRRVYGGFGTYGIDAGGRAYVKLENLEPHARHVSRATGIKGVVTAEVRPLMRRLFAERLRLLRAGQGLARATA